AELERPSRPPVEGLTAGQHHGPHEDGLESLRARPDDGHQREACERDEPVEGNVARPEHPRRTQHEMRQAALSDRCLGRTLGAEPVLRSARIRSRARQVEEARHAGVPGRAALRLGALAVDLVERTALARVLYRIVRELDAVDNRVSTVERGPKCAGVTHVDTHVTVTAGGDSVVAAASQLLNDRAADEAR